MVSVIIPTFKGADGIKNTVDSVFNQTYKDIEIIVVDDNGKGTENQTKTEKAVEVFVNLPQFKYIALEKNSGGSVARNVGARASRGEYFMFLDDDDTVSSDKIEKQLAALENSSSEYGISYTSSKIYCDDVLSNIISAKKSGNLLYDFMMGKIYMGTGTVLLKKTAWEAVGGYDESFVRHQDWEFFARILNSYKCIAVEDAYFNRYITNRNLPANIKLAEKYMDHYIEFVKKYDFNLTQGQKRKIINMNNSRIAIKYFIARDFGEFGRILKKYDNAVRAFGAFMFFFISACVDKLKGRKS